MIISITNCNLQVTNSGGGTITSNDGQIDCGQLCTADYQASTTVTLTATPDQGYIFLGWTGDCDRDFDADPTCEVVIGNSGSKSVAARF